MQLKQLLYRENLYIQFFIWLVLHENPMKGEKWLSFIKLVVTLLKSNQNHHIYRVGVGVNAILALKQLNNAGERILLTDYWLYLLPLLRSCICTS